MDHVSHSLLSAKLKQALRAAGLTTAATLATATVGHVATVLGVSLEDAREYRRELDAAFTPPPPPPSASSTTLPRPSPAVSALQLIQSVCSWLDVHRGGVGALHAALATPTSRVQTAPRRIATFSQHFDALLGGGVPVGEITEICGVPGVGKTQVCMQLCLNASIPTELGGVQGGAVYIDTEGSLMPLRLAQMANALHQHLTAIARKRDASMPGLAAKVAEWNDPMSMLSRVHVFRCLDLAAQTATIHHMPAFCAAHPHVKAIIIDSMAFHYRYQTNGAEVDLPARSRQLQVAAQVLHQVAVEQGLAIIAINHVTTKVGGGGSGGGVGDADDVVVGGGVGASASALAGVSAGTPMEGALPDGTLVAVASPAARAATDTRLMPALGEVWAHACTNRVLLGWDEEGRVRLAQLIKSPALPPGIQPFLVTGDGVRTKPAAAAAAIAPVSSSAVSGVVEVAGVKRPVRPPAAAATAGTSFHTHDGGMAVPPPPTRPRMTVDAAGAHVSNTGHATMDEA